MVGVVDVVRTNLDAVRDRIARAGGDPAVTDVIAVTKEQPDEAVAAALAVGLTELGENRADALIERALATETNWHYLGKVQRNKVARLAPHVALWQSVDRAEVGAAIARHAPGARVLVQVNLTDDAGRGGAALADVPALVRDLRADGLDVRGLMAVGPLGGAQLAREGFTAVVDAADALDLPVRSIGMSDDLEVAIECGSTMVRLGAALFGPRPQGITVAPRKLKRSRRN